jgi:Outer membrane protein beta-barrel domain
MVRRIGWLAFSLLGCASLAGAQDHKFEIGGNIGYTLADGVSGDALRAGDGNVYDTIEPKDSASFSLQIGYHVGPNWEIGFLWDRQATKLQVAGTATTEIGDMNLDNYHGIFTYNFGEPDAVARPYLALGFGATTTSGIDFVTVGGQTRTIDSNSRFSGSLGAGVKIYPGGRNFGVNLGARWVPTYIKSDSEGYWCDPYWGCYVVGDAQYSNQFEFAGGIILRF